MKTGTLLSNFCLGLALALLASFFVIRPLIKPVIKQAPTVAVPSSFTALTTLTNAWQDGYKEGQSKFNITIEANSLRNTWKQGYMTAVSVTASNVILLDLGKISGDQLSARIADGLTNNPWYLVPENP